MEPVVFKREDLEPHFSGKEETILQDLVFCQCGEEYQQGVQPSMSMDEAFAYLAHHLPAFNYVRTQLINFMFSDGLTTGDEKQDEEILNPFLYGENINGDTNYKVLQEAVAESMTYGRHGIRWLSNEDGIIGIHKKRYAPITIYNTKYYGFRNTVGYLVSFGKEKIYPTKLKELMGRVTEDDIQKDGTIIDKEHKQIILSKDNMLNVKHGLSTEHGESVLEYDKQRILLLENWFSRLNYDIVYDGPGRIILHKKAGYESETGETISTGKVMSKVEETKRLNKSDEEVKNFAKQVKDSGSDNVIVASGAFSEKLDHLPRTTKATELLNYMTSNMESAVAQFFGVTPALFGMGKIAGNVSMEKVIDSAMLNSIIPLREMYAVQISALLSEKLGVDKIYFNKYNMQQQSDEHDKRVKLIDSIVKLLNTGNDMAMNLAINYMNLLNEEIPTIGKIRNLGIKTKQKIKRMFRRSD